MIKINNLSFSYGREPLLENISLDLERGKFYGIIGPNGCGKSTLLSLISGLLKPDKGEILLNGDSLGSIPRKKLAKKISLMPQIRPTPYMTVEDYLLCGRYPYRSDKDNSPKKDREIVLEALKLTETISLALRPVNELSGGERQRVYLALLLTQNTELILCDEPTTHLDIAANLSVMNIICGMKDKEKCVVAVLHDLASALRLCDELILIDRGRIIDIGTAQELIKRKSLDKVFGVKVIPINTENGQNFIFE